MCVCVYIYIYINANVNALIDHAYLLNHYAGSSQYRTS
jgi:hypothetical protein